MNDAPPPQPTPPPGHHLATISHDGRFWDVHIDFMEDPRRVDSHRARLRFTPGDPGDGEGPTHTAVIFIEASYEEVIHKARQFNEPQLVGLLRSAIPGDDD